MKGLNFSVKLIVNLVIKAKSSRKLIIMEKKRLETRNGSP